MIYYVLNKIVIHVNIHIIFTVQYDLINFYSSPLNVLEQQRQCFCVYYTLKTFGFEIKQGQWDNRLNLIFQSLIFTSKSIYQLSSRPLYYQIINFLCEQMFQEQNIKEIKLNIWFNCLLLIIWLIWQSNCCTLILWCVAIFLLQLLWVVCFKVVFIFSQTL